MNCKEKFFEIYGKEAEGVSFCPYRVCPIGAHIDHQLGKITGFAIDKGISIAYRPKQNGVVELVSLQFPKRAQFHIASVPKDRQLDWADYLRGATLMLSKKFSLEVGLCGVIEGSLPIGGLSSSAAVIISFLTALCKVNNIKIEQRELIKIAQKAENEYVGVSCGKLDQSCEVFCRKEKLLYLDNKDDSFELISQNPDMKLYEIGIFFSGMERNLIGSGYNMRIDEVKSAAYALMAFSGMDYGKFNDTYLRDVPKEIFDEYKDCLPENWRKRAEHFYTESERVEKGVDAWRKGDLETFGQLVFESGYSSIYNYETGADELKEIYNIMRDTKGIYGGRFSGAGFKGCCMALIDPEYKESIEKEITEKYLKAFPQYKETFSVNFCKTADGCGAYFE